jgi:hypothetical protein
MKTRKRRIDVGSETRRRAREKVGLPPAARVLPDKRRRPQKHKKPLADDA